MSCIVSQLLWKFISQIQDNQVIKAKKICWSGNRFSRKRKEKEKAQEDMAWQIAKMIIDDINREVTSNQTRSDTMSETAESTTSGAESGLGDQNESTHLWCNIMYHCLPATRSGVQSSLLPLLMTGLTLDDWKLT